jgi:hypothetical protein
MHVSPKFGELRNGAKTKAGPLEDGWVAQVI